MANESDYNPMIEQNVGDIGGDFTKSITIEAPNETDRVGDIEAGIDAIHTIFQYIPELVFVSIYGLIMFAAVLIISKKIKG